MCSAVGLLDTSRELVSVTGKPLPKPSCCRICIDRPRDETGKLTDKLLIFPCTHAGMFCAPCIRHLRDSATEESKHIPNSVTQTGRLQCPLCRETLLDPRVLVQEDGHWRRQGNTAEAKTIAGKKKNSAPKGMIATSQRGGASGMLQLSWHDAFGIDRASGRSTAAAGCKGVMSVVQSGERSRMQSTRSDQSERTNRQGQIYDWLRPLEIVKLPRAERRTD